MKKRNNIYPLLPYSQLVWEMEQQMPGVYDSHILFRFDAERVDVERLRRAIEKAVDNHPVFAQMGDEYYRFLVWEENGVGYLDSHINRILGDTQSTIIFTQDIKRAYLDLPLEKDHYFDYLERFKSNQQTDRYQRHKEKLINEYSGITCPVRPTVDYPLQTEETWRLGQEFVNIVDWSHPRMSPNQLVCLATTIAIMDYCHTDEAALTWAYLGRETIEDQHVFGSLHKDIPMRIHRAATVEEYIKQVRQQCRNGIACSDYPLTLTHPYSNVWNYAVNVLDLPDLSQAFLEAPFAIEPLPEKGEAMAYGLLDIEIESKGLLFRYSATHYKEDSIKRFAEMVVRNINWLRNE